MHPLIRLTLLAMLSSCAHYQERPLNASASATRIEARSLNNSELQQFIDSSNSPKNRAWNLDKLTLAALFYHPDLALARAQADSADASIVTAGLRPNPNFTLTPTWISNLAAPAIPWIIASSLSIPIETAGKRGYRIDKSQHLTDAASLRIADAAWLVRGRLRLAMLDVYAAQESVRFLQQQCDLEQAINQYLQQRQAAGELAETDVLTAQLGLQQTQLNLIAAQKKLANTQTLLATAIGVPVAALTGIELDFSEFTHLPDFNAIPTAQLQTIALRQRPDVLASLADYAAVQSALQLEIANQYPNIQVNPGYTWDIGSHYWVLGANALQLPIFHQNQGPIAESEAKRQEASVRFEALQLRILGEIDHAHASALAMSARWQAAGATVQNRQANLRLVRDLAKAGELDAHAVAVAELEQSVAERARLDVLVESQQSLAMLEASLRQPLTPTLTNAMSIPALRKPLP
ncbi:MAG: TolC family protein [Methylovulum sp.]|uniref:TolC family protein n=1 Tax=Methylovulum sp. TaxID=1916980 RepID=UPI002638589B|nr:TolC family protein [Methylovulum sp.]MDD2722645.1 TolC family protein [Methylovulum sp.]MDD5123883.1 TolC family protein [Methylovulum sp.]